MRIGADSGGTFTDVVGTDGRVLKVPSTPADPGDAVRDGTAALAPDGPELLAHGTTVATNALLERRGARVALYCTAGFADVIEIARQDRPSLYDPWAQRPEPLVARADRLEVDERVAADGAVLVPMDIGALPPVPDGVEAVAVCLLHSDRHPGHEAAVAAALDAAGFDVSASHRVAPEFREYERTVTTVLNAYLRPICGSYLAGLDSAADDVVVMTSAGGSVDLATAAELPVLLLLSGPAGGARAAAAVASACGFPDALSFDMGGTSTDVCLILDGAPRAAPQQRVAGIPVRAPALDIHTIGAGGGSIARLDSGGALVVGPESAGARPGPACYGHGGTRPTVTDADLVAGRIPSDVAFGDLGVLDIAAARAAIDAAGIDAEGVIAVVNAGMERALRAVSVEQGVDPAGLALVAFGGAGPLHACELAESLDVAAVIVPAAAGVLSAVGLLTAPGRRELVRSWPGGVDHDGLDAALDELAARARELVAHPEPRVSTAVDCRYRGQSHELRVPSVAEFPEEHRRRNGEARPGEQIEVVALRAVVETPAPATVDEVLAAWDGRWTDPVVGPQVVVREDCTIWVPDGWRGEPGPLGSLVLTRVAAGVGA
ncbi:MAG TPA: hydantoinase/oxoprolinase family protein [Microthrixaceae bacterium]|nr:hydantoinase/oxoprolinase family protein [Microthrixaceae bacterium]HMV72944.1 hydantoinase/oxoprolinase family protein [Microthrixaceae bacterium]HMX05959.1 hydantoinase/oxoprolinase family protein [Microthrixaceae bacterium]HMX66458.1 hydantoinase/oxoprolinase family protein [Microthrixaceae bacterium]HMY86595.1 hydantoinase/oxoprolinase family protein [Microthrixaceae bacterium]